MTHTSKFKKGYSTRVNIYSALSVIAAIIFGSVMESALFIFLGFSLAVISFLSNSTR